MVRNWGISTGGIPFYYATEYIPQTSFTSVMGVWRNYSSSMPWIEKKCASWPPVTTSCVTGFLTWPTRLSHPRICMTTPSSTLVVRCREWIPYSVGTYQPKTCHRLWKTHSRRSIFSSGTSGRRKRTVFTTCVLWILMPPPTCRGPSRNVSR